MKSVKVKSYQIKQNVPVYDIEVPGTHNFILDNGTIAHNCAHSTSYGIVSYATAWLKNNYPLEFWTAELSVEYGDEDKLREYSQLISDKLLQPSVLHSDTTDFVIEGDKIRVPLCVLKGVGEEAAKAVKKLMHNSLEEIGLTKKPQVAKNTKESTKRAKVLSDQKPDDNLLALRQG